VNLQCSSSDGGGVAHCKPTTCAAQNIACGPLSDGCGGILECRTCITPLTCKNGEQPRVCGSGAPHPCDLSTTDCLQAQDKPTPSPALRGSTCVEASGCLEAAKRGGDCEHVTGTAPAACQVVLAAASPVSEKQVCLHTLKDIFTSSCSWSGREIPCLCGT